MSGWEPGQGPQGGRAWLVALENGPGILGKRFPEAMSWALQVSCSFDIGCPGVAGGITDVGTSLGAREERALI